MWHFLYIVGRDNQIATRTILLNMEYKFIDSVVTL